jgi:hypothetical protein
LAIINGRVSWFHIVGHADTDKSGAFSALAIVGEKLDFVDPTITSAGTFGANQAGPAFATGGSFA